MPSYKVTYRKPGESTDKTVRVVAQTHGQVGVKFAKAHPTWKLKKVERIH